MELGSAARSLIDGAAVTQMAHDATEATLLLKRLTGGLRLVDLAPPSTHEELGKLLEVIRTRAEKEFLTWADQADVPEIELRAGLEAYERCSAAEMAGVLRDLTPAASPRRTLIEAVKEAGARCGILTDDLIARDIGWALVKAALTAAEAYSGPLKDLARRSPLT